MPVERGTLPLHTEYRVRRAVELFRERESVAAAARQVDLLTHRPDRSAITRATCRTFIVLLSGGTPHKPNPRDSAGFPVWEATAAARRVLELGAGDVPATCVLEETFSLDTIGNVSNK